jgi:uncharacterized protein DUF6880
VRSTMLSDMVVCSRQSPFLVSWPSLDRAARTITARAKELDGDHYEFLTPAADALAAKYPLDATLMLGAMIDFSLMKSRTSRYGHAARHLRQCQGLASAITDYASFEPHDVYVTRLRMNHDRKHRSGAWFPNFRGLAKRAPRAQQ